MKTPGKKPSSNPKLRLTKESVKSLNVRAGVKTGYYNIGFGTTTTLPGAESSVFTGKGECR